jgi:uncharacterized protein YkwD
MKTLKIIYLVCIGILTLNACKKDNDKKENIATPPSGESNAFAAMEAEIVTLVNAHRKSKGLAEMQSNNIIATEARVHSANMANSKAAFGHDGFDTRLNKISSALGGIKGGAENVASDYILATSVMNGWLNSSQHKANIEGNYNLIGVGVAKNSNGKLYYTQLFISKP